MVLSDEIAVLKTTPGGYDQDGNPYDGETDWMELGKCFISFNSKAEKVVLNDGSEYQYSYYVIMPIKTSDYPLLPREGDKVRIRKSDGTIDCEKEVKGFVTYKKRYLKIWV